MHGRTEVETTKLTPTARKHVDEALREVYAKSLFALGRNLCGFHDLRASTHGDIIRCLESSSTRKLICVPRGCLKSSIACVAYPIWLLIRDVNLRIFIDSELYTNSKTFLREIKGHLESPKFSELWGDWVGPVWTDSEIVVNQRTKVLKEGSISVGGVGTTKTGMHYDVIICDDLNSQDNTNTPENAQKVIDHFRYLISILEPDGILVVIGTRYSQNDVIGYILETEEIEWLGEKVGGLLNDSK